MNQRLGTYMTIVAGEDICKGRFLVVKGRKGSKAAFMLTNNKATKNSCGVAMDDAKKGETIYVAIQGHCWVVSGYF